MDLKKCGARPLQNDFISTQNSLQSAGITINVLGEPKYLKALIDYHQCILHMELSMNQLHVRNMSFLRNNVVKTIVNQKRPELGCSPDGLVVDPSSSEKYGLLEIKCLQCFKDVAPDKIQQGLADNMISKRQINQSCFKLDANNLPKMRTDHGYHYLIPFQMAVMEHTWCDFVLWLPKGSPSV